MNEEENKKLLEKINSLEFRITKLEEIERKRRQRQVLTTIFRIIIYIILITVFIFAYIYVEDKIIKPYKQTVNEIQERKADVEEKVDEYTDKYLNNK